MKNPENQVAVGRRSALIGSGFVLAGALGFSAKAVFVKMAYAASDIDAITLMALRMLLSLPFFLAAVCWADCQPGTRSLSLREWGQVIALGAIGYYLASYLDFYGLTYIPVALERLILFLYPTLVVIFSALIVPRQIRRGEIRALVLSYCGILLVFVDTLEAAADGIWTGAGLVFASAVVFAIFMMGSGIMIGRIGPTRFTAYSMSVACVVTGLHFGLGHESRILELPSEVYALTAMMAIFSTVLPAFLINAGVRRLGSGQVSIMTSIGPVMTLFLGYFVLDEALTAIQLLGAGLVMAGVYCVSREKSAAIKRIEGGRGRNVMIKDR